MVNEISEQSKQQLGQDIANAVIDYMEKHPKGITVNKAIAYVVKTMPLVEKSIIDIVVPNTFLLLGRNNMLVPVGKKTFRILTEKEMRRAKEEAQKNLQQQEAEAPVEQ